ncbi:rbr-type e3 ubiquitin transferase [Anaeramoeba ignava]|uniref:Rbr-type e3 ubiquitin transferase n=1 Tax=Anaeramoeba ignava TaxID=1746090 RepID=A0A9Q0LPG0_ANAIG|nr:rbr-type e3 ubiquitin transferase [Anaeramoeba ignava]
MDPNQQRNIPNEQFNSNHPSNKKPLSKSRQPPKRPTKPPPKLPSRTSPPNNQINSNHQNNEYSNEHFMIAKISTHKTSSFFKEGKEIYDLVLNQSGIDHIRDNSSTDEISNVISFTGNTHSGKSTLINALLTSNKFNGKTGNVGISPKIGIETSLAMPPTTGNLWVIDDPNSDNYRYLDFEGNSAGSRVPIDIDIETKKFLKKNQIDEQKYAKERRKAVGEHFPRLSYLVSNVIVYISTLNFADNIYYSELLETAKKSTQKVQSAEKPALILVKNKCLGKYETDYEKLTQSFFDAHAENLEDPKLLRWYSEVHCVSLPNFDIEEPNSIEIFQKEIERLKELINQVIKKQNQNKKKLGILYNQFIWIILFELVVKEFQENIRMSSILSKSLLYDSEVSLYSFRFFEMIMKGMGLENYLLSKAIALKHLAITFAIQEIENLIIVNMNTTSLLDYEIRGMEFFDKLYPQLLNQQPYQQNQSNFTNLSEENSQQEENSMFTYKRKSYIFIKVTFLEAKFFMRGLKNVFTQNEPISLKTNLEFSETETQSKKIFSETILNFREFIEKSNNLQDSLQQIYLQYAILNKEINDHDHDLRSYLPNDTCSICFHPAQEKQLTCGHLICGKCDFALIASKIFFKEGKEIYGLEINQSAVDHIRDNSSKDEISNVISFTGNTHSGKSTLINALLTSNKFNGKTGNVGISPKIGIETNLAMPPTTGNLWVIDDPNSDNYRYLDFEGNSAGSRVPIDIDIETKNFLKENKIKEQKYAKERRKSVEEHFPRLSYLVSNVIVYISTSDFAANKYYSELLKIAKKSTKKVQSAEKPALILVKNKCLKYETDYEKLTQSFFDEHAEDPENPELLRWYSEVHCVSLPNFDIEEPNSIEIFKKEIERLKELINQVIEKQNQNKKKLGILYNQFIWIILFELVVKKFQENIRMSSIISKCLLYDLEVSLYSFRFFEMIMKGMVLEDYLLSEKNAIKHLAITFVVQEIENLIKINMNATPLLDYQKKGMEFFDKLYPQLLNQQPCQSIQSNFTNLSEENSQEGIQCSNLKIKKKFMRGLKSVFSKAKPILWKGNFQFPETETQSKKIFSETILNFREFIEKSNNLQNSLQQIYLQYAILNKEINDHDHTLRSYLPSDTCTICFHPAQEKRLTCGHLVCEKCIEIFGNLPDLIESNLNNETIQNPIGFCSYCKDKVGVQNI